MKRITFICLFCFVSLTTILHAQQFTEQELRARLDSTATKHPGFNNELQLNVSSLQLSELVNSIALENNLNISIDPGLNQLISYNFFDAQVKDVLVFIYLNFEVEFDFVGSIIAIRKREIVLPKPTPTPPKKVDVKYNPANKFLSMNLRNDTLWKVVEEITKVSGINFVVAPEIRDQQVNAYLLNRPFEQVLEMFAKSNSLELANEGDYFKLGKGTTDATSQQTGTNNRRPNYQPNSENGDFILTKNDVGTLDIFARNIPLANLIQAAADETEVQYVMYSIPQGMANIDIADVRFDELLDRLFKGSTYSYIIEDDLYVIGENKGGQLVESKLVRLENRTIESVKTALPAELQKDLTVLEFPELNGLIVTGPPVRIRALENFISSIDVVVPMVQIDIMIIKTVKHSEVSKGMKAGIKDVPTPTSGTLFPSLEMDLGAESINNLLQTINGFGIVNLGQVTENFYMTLQAMEANSFVDIESTPKISTLNGHEAKFTIGKTTYYQQTQVDVQTSVTNSGIIQSSIWQDLNADLQVTVTPFVSADEHVTLNILVDQKDFDGFNGEAAPPNMSTQSFSSLVRMKNGEMILLGGLEEKERTDSGEGVPFLARIPVIKWFFSNRTKIRDKSKFHVLIRPVVTY